MKYLITIFIILVLLMTLSGCKYFDNLVNDTLDRIQEQEKKQEEESSSTPEDEEEALPVEEGPAETELKDGSIEEDPKEETEDGAIEEDPGMESEDGAAFEDEEDKSTMDKIQEEIEDLVEDIQEGNVIPDHHDADQ